MPAKLFGWRDPALLAVYPDPASRRAFKWAIGIYMRWYHRLEVEYRATLPASGPYLALSTHFSYLDVPALVMADPYYPWTTTVVKRSLMRIPLAGHFLRVIGAIPVARHGRDISAVRAIRHLLFDEGRGICIAAEGTRARSGRLGAVNASLVSLVVEAVRKGVPVFPVAVSGSFEALPPGAYWPKRRKLRVIVGPVIDFSGPLSKENRRQQLAAAAELIQSRLAELLPPERRPAAGTPAMSTVAPA